MDNNKNKFDFYFVKGSLNQMLSELDNICIGQVRNGFSKLDIDNKLKDIDNFIADNKQIQDALIENSGEVKKIIDSLNKEINSKMESFKGNFQNDEDVNKIDGIIEKFKTDSEINKRVKDLDEFDKKTFEVKSISERKDETKKDLEKLEKDFDFVSKYKDIVDKDPSLNLKQSAIDVYNRIKDRDNQKKHMKKTDGTFLTQKDYSNMLGEISKISEKMKLKNMGYKVEIDETEKKKLGENLKSIKALGDLSDDSDVKKLCAKITKSVTFNNGKITNIDKSFANIEIDDIKQNLNQVITNVNKEDRKVLIDLLNSEQVFNLNPELKQQWLGSLNDEKSVLSTSKNGADTVSKIKEGILNYVADKKLINMIDFAENNKSNLKDIENEKLKAEIRYSKLNKLNEKLEKDKSTTTVKVFGKDLEIKDDNGKQIDFSKVSDEKKSEIVEQLCEKFTEKEENNEALNEYIDNNKSLITYNKPNLLSRILYKLNPKHWRKGDNLATVKEREAVEDYKSNALKTSIINSMDDMKTNSVGCLTPEEKEKFKEADKKRIETAKKKARESIVKNGKGSKEAIKNAQKDINDATRTDDYNMDL